jgi:hypothetical protein
LSGPTSPARRRKDHRKLPVLDKILNIDRRIIYLVIGLAAIVPFLINIQMPIYVSNPVQKVYDYIEKIPEGGVVVVGFNFSPSTMPELYPMSLAVLRHCCSKKLKIIGLTLYSTAATMADNALKKVAGEFEYKELEDYVYLGYKPDAEPVMLGLGEDISGPFPTDYMNHPISQIPMLKNIKNYNDIDLVIDFGSANSTEWWIAYAGARYHQTIAAGCTGVMVSGYYPYLKTGQLVGLIGGLKGAAEYEKLVEKPGKATLGMSVQSIIHITIIILVIFGNVVYFISRRKAKENLS